MGEGSSLSMQGGSVTLSSADHDVNLDGVAALNWDGTTGTGGVIDRWEPQHWGQQIHIPIGSTCTGGYCVEYKIHNHGPSEGQCCVKMSMAWHWSQVEQSKLDGQMGLFGPRMHR